jgi:hypothetical protein
VQLRDAHQGAYFLEVFGRPKREILCSCDRDMGPNLSQSLHLINSPNLNGKLGAKDGRVHTLIKAGSSDLDIVSELYLAALSRWPSPEELHVALQQVRADLSASVPGSPNTLPQLVGFTPSVTVPALVLSQRLYGNVAFVDDLIARNGVQHPGFVPGGVTLEVLSHV